MRLVSRDHRSEFLRCRTLGHQWDDIPVTDRTGFGEQLWMRCLRCATERHDGIDTGGRLTYRRYVYPLGYDTAFAGDVAPTRSDFRLMLLDDQVREQRRQRSTNRKRNPA